MKSHISAAIFGVFLLSSCGSVYDTEDNDESFILEPKTEIEQEIKSVIFRKPRNSTERRCMSDKDLFIDASKEAFFTDNYAAVLMAQGRQESSCRADVSSKYADGYMEFTYNTARGEIRDGTCAFMGKPLSRSGVKRLMMNKEWSIRCGARYMRKNDSALKKLFPNTNDRWLGALAAYNGGLGWIFREHKLAVSKGYPENQYYGSVDSVCKRAKWACKENHHYPINIVGKWLPDYVEMGMPNNQFTYPPKLEKK